MFSLQISYLHYFRLLLLDILKTLTTEEFIRYQVLFYFQQPENDRISCKYYCQAVARRCSAKKCVLKIPQNSQENIYTGIFLLIKFQASNLHKFIKLIQYCTENQLNFLVNWSKSSADLFTFIYYKSPFLRAILISITQKQFSHL